MANNSPKMAQSAPPQKKKERASGRPCSQSYLVDRFLALFGQNGVNWEPWAEHRMRYCAPPVLLGSLPRPSEAVLLSALAQLSASDWRGCGLAAIGRAQSLLEYTPSDSAKDLVN